MIGIYSAVASANHMAPWGGAETLLGTNPIAVAIPAGEEAPVVLDIATTVVSYGTVKAYQLQGKPMPDGWMVERQGRQADHRFRAQRRRPAAADRRLQGQRAGARARAAGRRAQRRRLRPRRGRLQRRRRERLQHRPFHHRARRRALRPAGGVQGRDRPPAARSAHLAARCPASTRSACPASSAARAARTGCATACRCRRNCWRSSISWRAS